jgi:KDO2-lipid IV(A) lauroyltransferase
MTIRKYSSRLTFALLIKGIAGLARLLPWKTAVFLGGSLGIFLYYILGRYRKASLMNFKTAFGDTKNQTESTRIIKNSFINLGKSLIEILVLPKLKPHEIDSLVSWEGEEYLKDTDGKGVILITGHIGNWELMGASIANHGYPIHAIATPLYNFRIDQFIINLRSLFGVKTISRGTPSSSRKILEVLRRKEILALLIDQDTRVDGVFVPFFNKKAYTPSGAAQLAVRVNAITVMAFMTRLPNNRHRITIEKPMTLFMTGDKKSDIEKNTMLFTSRIEQKIRMHPDQWVWMHSRWKTEVPSSDESA